MNKTRRPAIRLGDPESKESLTRVIDRYGAIEDETFDKLIQWLDENKDEYNPASRCTFIFPAL